MRVSSIFFLVACFGLSGVALADGHSPSEAKEISRQAAEAGIGLHYTGGAIREEKPDGLRAHLAKSLLFQGEATGIRLHFVAIQDGRVVREHSSEPLALRKRPGRSKYSVAEGLPQAEFFTGLALKDFIVSASELPGSGTGDLTEVAARAFKTSGQSDGVFVVATFDDMLKGDPARGLVGFGSWN